VDQPKGGIYGRRLEILLVEDTSQPAETIAAFRKLNEADRSILLYVYSAETALVIHPHIQFNRIPTVVSFLPSDLANPSKFSYLFTVTPTVLDSAKIGIQFISEKSGSSRATPNWPLSEIPFPRIDLFWTRPGPLQKRTGSI